MLIVSTEFNCSNEILTIRAMMSGIKILLAVNFKLMFSYLPCPVPNIWLRPNNRRREADAAKARLTVPDGDHLTLLNVYN
jgi:pre-mRNA-splicing factor ATP-dependent RNA helicase DHX15/PRP43